MSSNHDRKKNIYKNLIKNLRSCFTVCGWEKYDCLDCVWKGLHACSETRCTRKWISYTKNINLDLLMVKLYFSRRLDTCCRCNSCSACDLLAWSCAGWSLLDLLQVIRVSPWKVVTVMSNFAIKRTRTCMIRESV